ncbi:MAG: hypothetical protein K0R93_1104 [Anaerosolibacter sp.]|jgi:hypothetical protein|nr:hypothetical protein [Anaerosolibacter sp.]
MIYIIIAGSAILLFLLVRWHTKVSAYICPKCKHQYSITPFQDFKSPQGPSSKYLQCSKCGRKSWTKSIRLDKK